MYSLKGCDKKFPETSVKFLLLKKVEKHHFLESKLMSFTYNFLFSKYIP